jgi:hypothetical protein
MMPESIRTLYLGVDEPMGWFPNLYSGPPPHWKTAKFDPIVDQRALPHFDWIWGKDSKLQPRRSKDFEVASISKKGENFAGRFWEPDFRRQDGLFHKIKNWTNRWAEPLPSPHRFHETALEGLRRSLRQRVSPRYSRADRSSRCWPRFSGRRIA